MDNLCATYLTKYFVVYALTGDDGEPAYIGVSSNPWARERLHAQQKKTRGLKFEVLDSFSGTGSAYEAEREYIREFRPRLNRCNFLSR